MLQAHKFARPRQACMLVSRDLMGRGMLKTKSGLRLGIGLFASVLSAAPLAAYGDPKLGGVITLYSVRLENIQLYGVDQSEQPSCPVESGALQDAVR